MAQVLVSYSCYLNLGTFCKKRGRLLVVLLGLITSHGLFAARKNSFGILTDGQANVLCMDKSFSWTVI